MVGIAQVVSDGRQMARGSTERVLEPAALPLNVLSIGVWEDDVEADCVRGDAVVARLYGLSEAEFAQGISRDQLFSMFHPDDVLQDPELRRSVRETGGLFVWEHRIVPEPDLVRWVLVRGHFERDVDGRMRGRGLIIDMTDARMDGHGDGAAHFLTEHDAAGSVVERMTDRALELWTLMQGLDAAGAARVRPLMEVLLYELGCQLAASTSDSLPSEKSVSPRDPKLH